MQIRFEYGNPGPYTSLGCSPQITQNLISWLHSMKGNAKELHIAQYLFNNGYLWESIKEIALAGCSVHIYSIPLEGYDNDRAVEVTDHDTQQSLGRRTKLHFAEQIYFDVINCGIPNIHFRIMPHMYLRSSKVRAFSRGSMPYSLHCKTLFLKCCDGMNYAGITSSNLAVRDAQKIELAFLYNLGTAESYSAEDFFRGLEENSIPLSTFDENADYSHYQIKMREIPPKCRLMFTAPFYNNSASDFEKNIESVINRANNRIIVCAQHVCSYQYSYAANYSNGSAQGVVRKDGFLDTVLRKSASGIPVKILSQTYVDAMGTHGCRAPENKQAFIRFTSAAQKVNCEYYANPDIHAKYIVADDNVIITTCNFTPTQFIYIPNVEISKFDNIPGYSYSGIHCEFGVYAVPTSKQLADFLVRQTETITGLPNSSRMF